MNVGNHRHRQAVAYLFQNRQALFNAEATETLAAGTIGLVKGRLVDERDAEPLANLLQFARSIERQSVQIR